MARDPLGNDIAGHWRAVELRLGLLGSFLVTALLVLGWALVGSWEDPRLDDLGIYSGLLAGLPPAVGAVVAAARAPGRRDVGAVIVRSGYHLLAMVAATIVQVLALLALLPARELLWVAVGGIAGCLVVPLAGSLIALSAGGATVWATSQPAGSGVVRRSLVGLLLVTVGVLTASVTLASTGELRSSRDFAGAIAILLGLEGDVVSEPLLWVARVAAVTVLALAVAIGRIARRPSG